jgi:hypothetical protein
MPEGSSSTAGGGDVKSKAIPDDVKAAVQAVVERFNLETFGERDCYYVTRYKGKHLYLDRCDYGKVGPICRLTYTGPIDQWGFAIFKWSTETYDSDEWMFPGTEYADGTVEGAVYRASGVLRGRFGMVGTSDRRSYGN